MNPSEKILSDLILHTTDLLRATAGIDASTQLELQRLVTRIEQLVLMNDPSIDRRALFALLDKVKDAITATMDTISAGTQTLLVEIATVQAEITTAIVNGAVGAKIMRGLTADMVAAIARGALIEGAPSKDWWARQSVILQQRFTDEMRQGLARGEALGDLIRRVRGRREFGFADGIMQTTSARARAIVHTSVMNVANETRRAAWDRNADIIQAIKWVATLDNVTCPICRALDGKAWSYPDMAPIDHDKTFPGVALHWSDRCIQSMVLKRWEEISGVMGAADIPVGTRASMTGQVPGDMTYSGWLRKQPAATAREILGRGRYELWKAGKLSLTEMTSQANRPLTIEQLRRRAGLPAT